MLDVFNIATPQGCNIQTFYGYGGSNPTTYTWVKPRGVSNVYMMLIGGGGAGNGTTGGGSGAVTVWYGSAQNVPDNLFVRPGQGAGTDTSVERFASPSIVLLRANAGSSTTGGTATTANQFAASGFYQSIAGQNGSASDIPTPSSTTFLSGGAASGAVVANYGYRTDSTNQPGSFRMQPIIVGSGGSGTTSNPVPGGIGCGGGAASPSGVGGPGMVLIASW